MAPIPGVTRKEDDAAVLAMMISVPVSMGLVMRLGGVGQRMGYSIPDILQLLLHSVLREVESRAVEGRK